MPFTVRDITLPWIQRDREPVVRAALVEAGQQCPPDETWSATVYDGPGENPTAGFKSPSEIGTMLTLRGSREKELVTSDWTAKGHDGPSFIYTRKSISALHENDAAWIDKEFRRAVVEFFHLT